MEKITFTKEQHRRVLQAIAGRMVTVNHVLMMLQTKQQDDFETNALLDAVQFMAETVGAMADTAIGGDVHGDMNAWLYGPLFAGLSAQERG